MNKKRKTTIDALESMKDNPTNLTENLGETQGGAQIPDPSDIPGGVMGLNENMTQSAAEAYLRNSLSKDKNNSKDKIW